MKYLSVCSGIEAATVAWEPLGWEALAFSEVAAFPRALLQYRYPFTELHGDFTTIGAKYHGTTDVLIGGTPCQDFSVAGLRKGLAGDRGNLTIEFVRLAEKTRPRWLVWENVPGVLSIDGGRAFGTFLKGLAECGYGFAYRVLDAQYFGVPQRRRRVFVVGYFGDWRPAAAVLFEREGLHGDITPRRKARQGITYDVAPSLTNSGRGTERAGDSRGQDCLIPSAFGGNNTSGEIDVSTACNAASTPRLDFESETFITVPFYSNMSGTQRSAASDVSLALKTAGSNAIAIPINTQIAMRHNALGERTGMGIGADGDPAFTLQAGHHHAICIKGAAIGRKPENGPQYGEILDDDSCYTLSCNEPHAVATFKTGQSADSRPIGYDENVAPSLEAGGGGNNKPALLQDMGVRRLTPCECERLMGYPDDYTLIPLPLKGRQKRQRYSSDSVRYKSLGNSMVTKVIRWLGERIEAVDQLF